MTLNSAAAADAAAWEAFAPGGWTASIDVRDFIQRNYEPYEGDASFLAGPTERTGELWRQLSELMAAERERGGVLDVDTHTPAGITAHAPGYLDAIVS
jgi:formate C-acetyltransferase